VGGDGVSWEEVIEAARQGRGVLRYARPARRALRGIRLPVVRPVFGSLYVLSQVFRITWHFVAKLLYREPLFRYRCERVGRRLNLEGAPPLIIGSGRIEVGDDVLIGSPCTWDVGPRAELIIGDRVSLNYRGIVSAATSVRIGDDTLIAGDVAIFDNTNHPVSPGRRLAGDGVGVNEVAPVIIGRNVWIGLHCIIMRGVTIGDNSVVAAGSVVTKSIPPNTLVAGNPAATIRQLTDD
jgi:carbonic anhydrase/acetyltransferase-like protein (isoleucine patch superfamily)